MFAAMVDFIFGSFINGIWLFVLGLFLRNASQVSYQQVVLRTALAGEHVDRFMTPNPVTVPPNTSVEDLVENYIYKYHFKTFPVASDAQLIGCVRLEQVSKLPRSEWAGRTVRDLMQPCVAETTVGPHDDAVSALSKMNRTQASRLLVVDQGRLVGVLALRDLLRFLSLKLQLEPAA
jgi:predicted transcriptional regulator